jgi:4-hydroxy-3-polyprenylbenzoate decarboxylase
MSERRLFVAITGASGAVYAKRLLEAAAPEFDRVYVSASEAAVPIVRDELGAVELDDILPSSGAFEVFDAGDLYAPPSSGSHELEAMVIIPCSMGTLGRVASGVSNDLITRAADVCLKERRKLVLVVRETPLSLVHLENMAAVTRAGAVVLPACPAFYSGPKTVEDMVDFVVDRVLRQIGVSSRLIEGWRE